MCVSNIIPVASITSISVTWKWNFVITCNLFDLHLCYNTGNENTRRMIPNMPEVIRWPGNNGTSSLFDFLERCLVGLVPGIVQLQRCLVEPCARHCTTAGSPLPVVGDDLYKAFLYSRNRAPPYKTWQSKSFRSTTSLSIAIQLNTVNLPLYILASCQCNGDRWTTQAGIANLWSWKTHSWQ